MYLILSLGLYLFSVLLNEIVEGYVSHQSNIYKYDRRIQKYLKSIYSNLKQALILLAILFPQQTQRHLQYILSQNSRKINVPGQQELLLLQSMINTQYTCNRCKQKVDQTYYCHDMEDGICYSCSKEKDKCSICNKKSNIPVKFSSKIARSDIKQNCNFCEKALAAQDKHIKTMCKHLICIECIVKKLCYVVKSCKITSKDLQENPILRIKCNCLMSQNINMQQFLRQRCFCCGECLEKNNYQQLLFGLKISWRCKALLSPRDFRNHYNQQQMSYMDIQKLSRRQKSQNFSQQSRQQEYSKRPNPIKQEKIDNNNLKSTKIQKNRQLQSKNSFYLDPIRDEHNKPIDNNQKSMLICQSCDCTLDKYSLILVDDSFYLCSSCQLKSKVYQPTKNKIKEQQPYFKDQKSIQFKKQSIKDQQNQRKNRIFFKNDLFYKKQQSPTKYQQKDKFKNQRQLLLESTCLSCDKTFRLSSSSNIKDQSQISDKFCPQCIEINHKIIKKQENPQKLVKSNHFFSRKSVKDMTYSEYLKQIIILQSPQIIQEPSQLCLKRRPSQQNKDRRAIYSVVEEFPQFQQLQIVGEQGQISYCYNCKLFSYKSNLIDCSQKLKKNSMACKMCFLILYSQ